ncbi:aminodeoxychorismate synthase component I [Spongorhabdus nitratireducens]
MTSPDLMSSGTPEQATGLVVSRLTPLPYSQDATQYFDRIRDLAFPVLLDSVMNHAPEQRNRRYDIMSAAPEYFVRKQQNQLLLTDADGNTRYREGSTIDLLREIESQYLHVRAGNLPFAGGLMGFWGYELNSELEPKLQPRDCDLPGVGVGMYLWAIISDHEQQQSWLVEHPACRPELSREIHRRLEQQPDNVQHTFKLKAPFQPDMAPEAYAEAFDRIQNYILAGDCYQVNLTQRFSAEYQGDLWAAYNHLRKTSPSPFSAYLGMPEMTILSHSPERFIKLAGKDVATHPIKGTRPRGKTESEDKALAEELLASPKDRSENLMIVDLLRNDLGRCCAIGSVRVPSLFALESYANVHHLVSIIRGRLANGEDGLSLLQKTFPGGSITGAPKIRSMEIIRELEPESRSAYCGSLGYISLCGRMDTSIAIRTLVAHDNRIHCWGGGAIVRDSSVDSEYEESVAKVRNLMEALANLTHS